MFKRATWFATGAAVGLGSSIWVQRRVRQAARHYTPDAVQQRATDAVRRVGPTVRDAVSEGRAAMHAREAEMRADVAARVNPPR